MEEETCLEVGKGSLTRDSDIYNVCGICSEQGQSKIASRYCKDCPEALCDECASGHNKYKFAKNHTIGSIADIDQSETTEDRQTNEVCEPCSLMSNRSIATLFCDECEEKLCDHCADTHKSMKRTKMHILTSINEYRRPSQVRCESCSKSGKTKNATVFCKDCFENLCSSCEKMHKLLKTTRSHQIVEIAMKEHATKGNMVPMPQRKCEPCQENGDNKEATNICKECKEFLCKRCTTFHKKQKITKHHNLFDAGIVPFTFCDLCSENGDKLIAIKECEVCRECFCQSCSKFHAVQKLTKAHKLREVTLPDLHACDICHEHGIDEFASWYCETCEVLFCRECSRKHATQKSTKSHSVIRPPNAIQDSSAGMMSNKDGKEDGQKSKTDTSTKETDPLQKQLRPGKPIAGVILSDSLDLNWGLPAHFDSDSPTYQLRFKEKGDKRWTFYAEQPHKGYVTVNGLKSQCTYVFQVRAIDGDIEGPYGPESDEISTRSSLATRLVEFTTKIKDGKPSVYKLHSTENVSARNATAKTRKFDLGKPPVLNCKEKTILLVGATGTGKSTLVDGIINYVTGVNWNDSFRFSLIDLEKDEANKNQAISQTEWITCYSINPEEGSRLDYRLNIIDTPGFGDTRGLERDNEIVSQLRELFSSKGAKGVVHIDAVCFLIKAPDARLTAVQKYIFMSILSLFGQDIEDNICMLITFADGDKPPVLAAMQEANLPSKYWYPFNNSGLFANNSDEMSTLAPIFWDMGVNSFKKFFDSLSKLTTKSLQQTKQVLQERERLEVTISQLQPQVDAGLSKVNQLKQQFDIFKQNEMQIKANKDFEFEVDEPTIVKIELPSETYVTNCLTCNRTCHFPCGIPGDENKSGCAAMTDGYCRICPGKCYWNKHYNNPHRFIHDIKKVKKTYSEMKKKYQEAGEKKVTHEEMIKKMEDDLEYLGETIDKMMTVVNECNNTLNDIALHPHPLSMVEHIDLMVESEKMEKKAGFNERIKVLQAYRKKAEIHKDIDKLKKEYNDATSNDSSHKPKPKKGFWANLLLGAQRLIPTNTLLKYPSCEHE